MARSLAASTVPRTVMLRPMTRKPERTPPPTSTSPTATMLPVWKSMSRPMESVSRTRISPSTQETWPLTAARSRLGLDGSTRQPSPWGKARSSERMVPGSGASSGSTSSHSARSWPATTFWA